MADMLAALREKFRDRCVTDAATVRDYLEGRTAAEPVERIVHRIAGAAGMFGAPELGQAAHLLDESFAQGRAPTEAQLRDLLILLDKA